MREEGERPGSVEVGNAWSLRKPNAPTNWIIGQNESTPADSLRFMAQTKGDMEGQKAVDVCVKWFVHRPDDPAGWGESKPTAPDALSRSWLERESSS